MVHRRTRFLIGGLLIACLGGGIWFLPGRDGVSHQNRSDTEYVDKRFDALLDSARGRRVPVTVIWPAATVRRRVLPLLVISHGGGGSRRSYRYLAEYLASRGYGVVLVEHVGSNTGGLFRIMWDQRVGLRGALKAMALDTTEWEARPRDVSFIIDQAALWNASDPQLRGHLDLSRVGVIGHSCGAYTAVALAGALVAMPAGLTSLRDPRVSAVVALSPHGPGGWGWFTEKSFRSVTVPVMAVSGSRDAGYPDQPPEWRKQGFDRMPAGDKYYLWLEGATHLDFAHLPLNSSRTVQTHRIVQAMAAAFFDAYLKGDRAAQETHLTERYARSLTGSSITGVRWHSKVPKGPHDAGTLGTEY